MNGNDNDNNGNDEDHHERGGFSNNDADDGNHNNHNNMTAISTNDAANIVRPCGYSDSECGYCKGKRCHVMAENPTNAGASPAVAAKTPQTCSRTYGLLVDRMQPGIYEEFLYRGWRRSGTHLYKPCNWESCCPTITIRLPVASFQPSKSQKKLQKRMNQLLLASSKRKMQQRHEQVQKVHKQRKTTTSTATAMRVLESLRHAGIVQYLETITRDILVNELTPGITMNVMPSFKLPSNHPIKTKHKDNNNNGNTITLTTPICAIIAGRYGKEHAVKRDELAKRLSERLRQRLLVDETSSSSSSAPSSSNSAVTKLFQTVSVDHHAASGQVLIRINVADNSMLQNGSAVASQTTTTTATTTNGHKNGSDTNNDNATTDMDISDTPFSTKGDVDRLASWYAEVTNGKTLSDDDRKQVRIQTLPAHESALQPEVHRLYAMYQHIVHNDPDPYAHSTANGHAQEATNSNNDTNINTTNGTENGTATNGGKTHVTTTTTTTTTNAESQNTKKTATASSQQPQQRPITEQIEQLDWGTSPPQDFVTKMRSVLKSYLQKFPHELQSSILQNYYNFYQFLVESPIVVEAKNINSATKQYECGTYHQHYRIGDVLIAVGVVDILPNGLSSVYLFYHPNFAHELVALGKWTTIQEIEFTHQVLKVPYYYLGYYIESCPKMRYKSEYRPSEMLCPVHYQWVPAEVAQAKLQKAAPHYVCALASSLGGGESNDDKTNSNNNHQHHEDMDVSAVVMDVGAGIPVSIYMLQEAGQAIVRPYLEDFVREAGPYLKTKCTVRLNG